MTEALALLTRGIAICEELCLCLEHEKQALISFEIDIVLENNLKKGNLISELVTTRKKLRETIKEKFVVQSGEDLIPLLTSPDKESWSSAWVQWQTAWQKTQIKCKENQRFIEHSLRNLTLFTDHLKELFGANTVYSKQGTPVDRQAQGAVVEGSY